VFLSGGFRLTAALLPLQSALLTINSVLPSAKTAHDILASASVNSIEDLKLAPKGTEKLSAGDVTAQTYPMGVKFDAVSFSYPGGQHTVLDDITFFVEAGSQVALMGPSGAGKSTIADLVCGVLRPTSGEIYLTNSEMVRASLGRRGPVGYVPQRPGLVSGTILDNVALAEDSVEVDRRRALEALELAHLGDLVSQLPDGLNTPLGKLQDGLSGGQMQRIGLARALYSKPSLLVMDEATSALDAESEAVIQSALEKMRGKVTVVLIAHRLNTVQFADKVLLIEDGKLTDTGTFKDLLENNKTLQDLVQLMKIQKD
jgi:ATP-binding cassette subfamily C protein